jgi:hypothetical protein
MEQNQLSWIANFIWGIADDVESGTYLLYDDACGAGGICYKPDSVKTSYEISFTRCFYKPQSLRTLAEIRAGSLSLERETEGVLAEISGGGTP